CGGRRTPPDGDRSRRRARRGGSPSRTGGRVNTPRTPSCGSRGGSLRSWPAGAGAGSFRWGGPGPRWSCWRGVQRGESPLLAREDGRGLLPDGSTVLLEYSLAGERGHVFALRTGTAG